MPGTCRKAGTSVPGARGVDLSENSRLSQQPQQQPAALSPEEILLPGEADSTPGLRARLQHRLKRPRLALIALLLCLLLLGMPLLARSTSSQETTIYTWLLVAWSNNQIACSLITNHEGLPSKLEIDQQCSTYPESLASQLKACPAAAAGQDTSDCEGYYLHLVSAHAYTPLESLKIEQPVWEKPSDTAAFLQSPANAAELASAHALPLLGGWLITTEVVNAEDCPDGGVLPAGIPNACGEQAARETVVSWQNQFDAQILEAARNANIPPYLLKNLFAVESQFWPATLKYPATESGLGHFTEAGADALLAWNGEFFSQFCPQVYGSWTCQGGYAELDPEQRSVLRGAVIKLVRVDCPWCALGINLETTENSIPVFAHALVAYARQVNQIIVGQTGKPAQSVASYDDLWRLAAANYNAGYGCVSTAISRALKENAAIAWSRTSGKFDPGCGPVADYVAFIEKRYELPPEAASMAGVDLSKWAVLSEGDGGGEAQGGAAPVSSLHTGYAADTDVCANCHVTHRAQQPDILLISTLTDNDFCYSCHDGSGAPLKIVSTHSNIDRPGVEAPFELLCIQCHDPHGSSNLFAIRSDVLVTASPALRSGWVVLTARSGAGSFDDGSSSASTRLCLTCHSSSSNPGYPMVNHAGGADHLDLNDYSGQDCLTCHPHSADNDLLTRDGFMP